MLAPFPINRGNEKCLDTNDFMSAPLQELFLKLVTFPKIPVLIFTGPTVPIPIPSILSSLIYN